MVLDRVGMKEPQEPTSLFLQSQAKQGENIADNTDDPSPIIASPVNNLNILTYNCKNAETSKYAI